MLRFPLVPIAIIVLFAKSGAQSPASTLDCNTDESVVLRSAPLGAARVSKQRLTVRWAGGTRVFQDSGLVEGYMDGVSYQYCGYSPDAKFHLIHKHDEAVLTGVLLDHTTGKVLPAGQRVVFAPGGSGYFATVQPDGLDGEEWYVYSIRGAQIWKGLSGITAKHPKLKYDYFIASLEEPRWSASGELQATLKCADGNHAATVVTLKRKGAGYAWQPAVACRPAG
jgi:hypothetical protein